MLTPSKSGNSEIRHLWWLIISGTSLKEITDDRVQMNKNQNISSYKSYVIAAKCIEWSTHSCKMYQVKSSKTDSLPSCIMGDAERRPSKWENWHLYPPLSKNLNYFWLVNLFKWFHSRSSGFNEVLRLGTKECAYKPVFDVVMHSNKMTGP